MNLPNKLTMARVIMIPFFVIFMLTSSFAPFSTSFFASRTRDSIGIDR